MTGAILAGGESRRMGSNKALIEIGGVRLIERTVSVLSGVFDDVLIAAVDLAPYEGLGARLVTDIVPGAGSLGGIYTALCSSGSEQTFICACDMPGLDARSVRRIIEEAGGADIVLPRTGRRLHPLHALYSRACIGPVRAMIEAKDLRVGALLDKVSTMELRPEDFGGLPIERSVENMNTREDLKRLTGRG